MPADIDADAGLAWLIDHAAEVTEAYSGRWIAVVAGAVAGVGATAREAHDNAVRKCGADSRVLLSFVEETADVIYFFP